MRRTLTVLIATAALIAPAGVAQAAPRGEVLQQRLDAVHAAGMPGAFAEVRDGGRRWTPTAGVADVRTGKPVRDGLRHRAGSITKTFVATTLLQLATEKRVDLDAPINRYVPARVVPADLGGRITVRMLLNQTSGLGDYDTVLLGTLQGFIDMGRTTYRPEQLVEIGLGVGQSHEPGTAWAYSNTNYIVAGMIIEKVTGRAYQAEVTRRVLRPLGLKDTYFEGADPVIRGPHMRAYVPWTDGELRDFTRYNMTWAGAAGELVSTAHDLNVFYRSLLTGKLLTRDALAQMLTTVPAGALRYGLGIYSVTLPCGPIWGHDGSVIGHQTIAWSTRDGGKQVAYAHNAAFYQSSPTEAHPIDVATNAFLTTAICGAPAPVAEAPRLLSAQGRQ